MGIHFLKVGILGQKGITSCPFLGPVPLNNHSIAKQGFEPDTVTKTVVDPKLTNPEANPKT